MNMQRVVNFGACKGETFDRVLIYPNGPLKKYLLKQEMLKSPEKYYVAVTRPRYSIAFVLDELPERIPLFQRAVIQLSGDSIKCFKFQSGE